MPLNGALEITVVHRKHLKYTFAMYFAIDEGKPSEISIAIFNSFNPHIHPNNRGKFRLDKIINRFDNIWIIQKPSFVLYSANWAIISIEFFRQILIVLLSINQVPIMCSLIVKRLHYELGLKFDISVIILVGY